MGKAGSGALLYRTKGSVRKNTHECCRRARVCASRAMPVCFPFHGSSLSSLLRGFSIINVLRSHSRAVGNDRGRRGTVMMRSPQCHHRVASAQTDKEAGCHRSSICCITALMAAASLRSLPQPSQTHTWRSNNSSPK